MIKKRLASIFTVLAISASLFTGCSAANNTIIPEEIIENAIKLNEKPKSYYGEFNMKIYVDKKIQEDSNAKQWVDNEGSKSRSRIETDTNGGKVITTNDGKKITIYTVNDKKAMVISLEDELEDIPSTSYKDQLLKELGSITKTHEVTFKDEEKVNGHESYHLAATPKEKNSIIGNLDYWIDKDTWFVIKVSSEVGNDKMQMEYTKLDFSAKFEDNLFTQTFPADVVIEDIGADLNNKIVIDLKEGANIAKQPILYLKDTSVYKIKEITYSNFERLKQKEIVETYERNGAVAFTLSIIMVDEEVNKPSEDRTKLPSEKDITVRGNKGTSMDDVIKVITWNENGLNYTILLEDPKLTTEDAVQIANSLSFTE